MKPLARYNKLNKEYRVNTKKVVNRQPFCI